MMGKVIMSGIVPQLVAPSVSLSLGEIAPGSIVKLNENGSPVEFYVAGHDYESGLNGTGRTILLRKDVYGSAAMQWNSTNNNTFVGSTMDTWLNGTYKGLFDSDVQTAMGETGFYHTATWVNSYTNPVTAIARAVFLPSLYEMGIEAGAIGQYYCQNEGSTLAAGATIRAASKQYWTRTIKFKNSGSREACIIQADGTRNSTYVTNASGGYVRPAFTLPASAVFDEKTLLFKGVS